MLHNFNELTEALDSWRDRWWMVTPLLLKGLFGLGGGGEHLNLQVIYVI